MLYFACLPMPQEMEEAKTEGKPSSSSPGPAVEASPVVVLKVASSEGRVRYSLTGDDAGPSPVPADDPLCFVAGETGSLALEKEGGGRGWGARGPACGGVDVRAVSIPKPATPRNAEPIPRFASADWGPFMGKHYSKTAWESPEKHPSLTAAEEAARKPAPALELSDCVEVCACIEVAMHSRLHHAASQSFDAATCREEKRMAGGAVPATCHKLPTQQSRESVHAPHCRPFSKPSS